MTVLAFAVERVTALLTQQREAQAAYNRGEITFDEMAYTVRETTARLEEAQQFYNYAITQFEAMEEITNASSDRLNGKTV